MYTRHVKFTYTNLINTNQSMLTKLIHCQFFTYFFSLYKLFKEAEASGRPWSPTDTHISSGSTQENTSMYGNAFRRVSTAVSFLRKLRDNQTYSFQSSNSSLSRNNSEGNMVNMADVELLNYSSLDSRKEDRRGKRRDSEQYNRPLNINSKKVQKSMTFSPGDKKTWNVPFKSGKSKKKTLEVPKIEIT